MCSTWFKTAIPFTLHWQQAREVVQRPMLCIKFVLVMNQPQYLPAVENASHPGLMLDGHGVAEFKFATHLGRKGCNKFGLEAFKAGAALEVLAQRVGVFNCHDPLKRCLSSATSCCYLAAKRLSKRGLAAG